MSIRSGQPDERPADRENLVCWNKDMQAQALRVEAEGQIFIFPFTHLVFAVLNSSASAEELRVSLTTHEIRIHGRNLREIALALQKLAVDWIRPIPSRFVTLAEKGASVIEKIDVTDLQSDAARNEAE